MREVVHFLSGLRYGGKEQVALRLARRGVAADQRHRLLLYDAPFECADVDIDPGVVPWTFLKRPRRFWPAYALRVARSFNATATTVVHAHDPTAITYAALSRLARPLRSLQRVRVVATFHITIGHLTPRALYALRVALGGCDRVAAVSEALASDLRERLNDRVIEVIPNGVDTNAFRPHSTPSARLAWRARYGISPDAIVVGTLGRLDPIKRQSDLVDAVIVAREHGANIDLVIAGDGPLRQELEMRAAGRCCVRLIGAIDNPASFYAGIDVFALPSDNEAAPLVLLEALACGLPIVATSVGGIPEIIGDADPAAILVPPRDPSTLGDALHRVCCQPELRSRLSESARRRAITYSEEKTWLSYRRWYDEVAVINDI